MPLRLIVIGGFLGAGKTSAVEKMAALLIDRGKKVGIVTNDQSENLVDTNLLRSDGLSVFEVVNGCFCCNFDDFANKLESLSKTIMPDIILAEPVGSCTDLVATIFKPLLNDYTKGFLMSPLSVMADPRRVKKFMAAVKSGYINEINYLFEKQLSEADIIVLNKIDLLGEDEIKEITSFLRERFKGVKIITVSALNNKGIDRWYEAVTSTPAANKSLSEIDYDVYAAAEAALGWYNGFATLSSENKTDINIILKTLLENIRAKCRQNGFDIAHLKAYAVSGADFAKASVTSSEDEVTFNKEAAVPQKTFNLILNARIEAQPDELKSICNEEIGNLAADLGFTVSAVKYECFAPSYPKPKHRIK